MIGDFLKRGKLLQRFPDCNCTGGGGGVTTFNSRTGAVVPLAGDYTPAMVGAAASTTQVIAGSGLSGGGPLSSNVTLVANVQSVFGRTGTIVAAPGDYSAAQVTNAVDQTQSYANPAWITSLPWSKLTSVPSTFPPSAHTHDASAIVSGIIAAARLGTGTADTTTFLRGDGSWQVVSGGSGAVSSVFTRTGAVIAQSGDYTAAQVTNAVSTLGSYADPSWITSLSYSKLVGAPTAVSSFNLRTGAVVPVAGDYTAAMVTNAISSIGSYADPSWLSVSWGFVGGKPSTFPPSAHTHDAADIATGVIATARLGTGTANTSTYLRGDGSWQVTTGSQTPWTQNIDGGGFNLSNVGTISCTIQNVSGTETVGTLLYGTDNTSDLGAAAASRPRTIYAGTSVVAPLFSVPDATGQFIGINHTTGTTGFYGLAWDKTNQYFQLYTAGAPRWQIDNTGNFDATTDNAYNIGALGANRPAKIYVGTNITFPDGTTLASASGVWSTAGTGIYYNAGNVGIGNALATPFMSSPPAYLQVGPDTGTNIGRLVVCGNIATSGPTFAAISFVNFAIAAADKRAAEIIAYSAGTTGNTTGIQVYGSNGGALVLRLTISQGGNYIFNGNAGAAIDTYNFTSVVNNQGLNLGNAANFLAFRLCSGVNYIQSGATSAAGSVADLRFGNITAGPSTVTWVTIQGSSGNVGIGTTGPSYLLHVALNGTTGPVICAENTNATSKNASLLFRANGAANWWLSTDAAGTGGTELNVINAAGTRVMVGLQSGNVGIGGITASQRLTVTSASVAYNAVPTGFALTTGTGLSSDESLWFGVHDGDYSWIQAIKSGTAYRQLYINPNGGDILLIPFGSGAHVGIGVATSSYQLQLGIDSAAKPSTTGWTVASDIRMKRNVKPYHDGLERIRKLHPVSYEYNGLGSTPEGVKGVGFSAQDLVDEFPEFVRKVRGKLNPDDKEETELLGVNPSDLIFMLLNAIKELDERTKNHGFRLRRNRNVNE